MSMMTVRGKSSAVLATMAIASAAALCTTSIAHAQSRHDHSAPAVAAPAAAHDHGAAAPSRLALNQGRKWATDAPLRAGMGRIRALVEPQLGAAHASKLTPVQYVALAGQVEREVGGIVANCKLEPKADAMLHLVIARIGEGTDAMAGKSAGAEPEQGLLEVVAAVNDYAKYFDHPRCAPIHAAH